MISSTNNCTTPPCRQAKLQTSCDIGTSHAHCLPFSMRQTPHSVHVYSFPMCRGRFSSLAPTDLFLAHHGLRTDNIIVGARTDTSIIA